MANWKNTGSISDDEKVEDIGYDCFEQLVKESIAQKTSTTKCTTCGQLISEEQYFYKCLECTNYISCSFCYERKSALIKAPHENCHAMITLSDRKNNIILGKYKSINEITLEKLSEDFKEAHDSFKCSKCDNPIIGLRFKCESCRDKNFCYKCYNMSWSVTEAFMIRSILADCPHLLATTTQGATSQITVAYKN